MRSISVGETKTGSRVLSISGGNFAALDLFLGVSNIDK